MLRLTHRIWVYYLPQVFFIRISDLIPLGAFLSTAMPFGFVFSSVKFSCHNVTLRLLVSSLWILATENNS